MRGGATDLPLRGGLDFFVGVVSQADLGGLGYTSTARPSPEIPAASWPDGILGCVREALGGATLLADAATGDAMGRLNDPAVLATLHSAFSPPLHDSPFAHVSFSLLPALALRLLVRRFVTSKRSLPS